VKFSLWPFRRKKALEEKPGPAVQPDEKTELPEIESGAMAEGEISRIEAPGVLPILGEAGGWNTMRIGQADQQPGVVPFQNRLEVSDSEGVFKPMIEPDEFARHLSGLSSFNISELLSGTNAMPRFPEDLPVLEGGMTDIFAQSGSIPDQIPGLAGIAPILSLGPQAGINRMVMEQAVDEPGPPVQLANTREMQSFLGIRRLSQDIEPQKPDPANNSSLSQSLIHKLSSVSASLISGLDQSMSINQPNSNITTILPAVEPILSEPDKLPLAGNFETPENILINRFITGVSGEYSEGEIRPDQPAATNARQENQAELPAMPHISGFIQMEKEDSQSSPVDNITPPHEQRAEVGLSVIDRMVEPSSQQQFEIEPSPLVYLDGGLVLAGTEDNIQSPTKMMSDPIENKPTRNRLNPAIMGDLSSMIGQTGEEDAGYINRAPIQLASSVQDLVLRQSRPADEMMMTIQMEKEESEPAQFESSADQLLNPNLSERQELNPQNNKAIENLPLIQKMEQSIGGTSYEENPIRKVLQSKEPGNLSQGLLQRTFPGSLINKMGPSVSRFAIPGQVPGMSMIENRVRNTSEEANQEMQKIQSAGMPLINQVIGSGNEMALGGGLPKMPLPPTMGETLSSLKSEAGGVEQKIPEVAEKAASTMGQAELPQLPNIDRLTDQIWQQIQRRLQIERERSRGMS
jgi:hypothetical protein